ncbi:MAG: response regulator [Planctomycetes bacterium]|nr:response regulator [Planctomycetota bacterium]
MKVLVVDDSSTMRRIISNSLQSLGVPLEITEAEDGNDGFTKYMASPDFELVLSDWNMPNCNGLEFLQKVVATGKGTPVIMVTTEAEKTNVITAIKAGAKNYITKPFTPDILAGKIKQTLGLK